MTASLGPAALVRIVGRDAIAFAHAQFTSDVRGLAEGAWQWSAWLDAQGRARAVFALLRTGTEELLAWQPLGDAAALAGPLVRFVFRAAVRIEAIEATAEAIDDGTAPVTGVRTGEAGGWTFSLADGRSVRLVPGTPVAPGAPALADWHRRNVEAGLPFLPAATAGEFTPQALGLESIDAIRFDKGCYPGQEVAARLHFRGGNKRRLRRATCEGCVEPGDALLDDAGGMAARVLYPAPGAQRLLAVVADGSPQTLQTGRGTLVRLD